MVVFSIDGNQCGMKRMFEDVKMISWNHGVDVFEREEDKTNISLLFFLGWGWQRLEIMVILLKLCDNWVV